MSDIQFPVSLPSAETKWMTLHRDGPLFILHLHNKDNRFTTDFIKSINVGLDIVEHAFLDSENPVDMALVTIGNDKIYSNGLDLMHAVSYTPFMNHYLGLLKRMLTFPIPTVAAINGHAFAGGCMLALSHDYRVMRNDRGFMCMNEVDLPSPLAPGMTALLRCKMTPNTFRNMVLQGHRFAAEQALAEHLVDDIAPQSEVLDKAKALALKWAPKAKSGIVYRQLKEEMYAECIRLLSVPYQRLAPKM